MALVVVADASMADETQWARTLETISTGVVSIQVDSVRAFDTEWNLSSQATGFVVDWEQGFILTNRHVVTPGPVTSQAVFLNHEEVELKPVYRDPVHDFGFYRFDPAALRFIKPHQFTLSPEKVQVGREIRVIGNDAGEQISILAGTLAKLDRQAPDYGRGNYSDFNTFYLQAASGTSGGSSGSPVVDIDGDVLALNAGGASAAASSFFLPLDRVTRALNLLRQGKEVSRGTLRTVFVHRPYDELRRLGLAPDTESMVRRAQPRQIGMLVVDQVVPGGSAEKVLQPGDILVRVNGELLTSFAPLEAILDDSVGQVVRLQVQRGGVVAEHQLTVENLHDITPHRFLEMSDAVLHTLSYQQARHLNTPVAGVFVANPGYMFSAAAIPRGSVITGVNGETVTSLEDLARIIATAADGERVMIRFYTFDEPQTPKLGSVQVDRRWYPARSCKRDDVAGIWPCQDLPEVGRAPPPAPASTRFMANGDSRLKKIAASLVLVNFDMPFTISGVSDRHFFGTGIVVDTRRGLVVVDRNTVPVALGDVNITFAGTIEVPGRVEYVHPLHNLALVSYDPALIGDTPVQAASFSAGKVSDGDEIWVVGLKRNSKPFIQKTQVATVDALSLPLSRTLRFRESNVEVINLVNAPAEVDGALIDSKARILAHWSSFAYQAGGQELEQVNLGLPADIVQEMVQFARERRDLRSLEAELALLPLSGARQLDLPGEWVDKLESHSPGRRNALQIVRLVAGSPAEQLLKPGDVLLALDGKVVNQFREIETGVQGRAQVQVTLWRAGKLLDLEVATVPLNGEGIDRVVSWAGALLQPPHRALAVQRGITPEGVYVAFFAYGSPASRYGLFAGRRIVEVDGHPTLDLDAFLSRVADKRHRDSVRIKTITWNNRVEVITLKLDKHYWPAYELRRGDAQWQRRMLD